MSPPPFNFEPVSPIDITADSKRHPSRSVGFATIDDLDEKADIRATTRSIRTNSTASTTTSANPVRRARFAEATSVFSPASGPGEHQSPFADPRMENHNSNIPKPSDVGFGYISDNQPVEQHATLPGDVNGGAGAPLKSALKTPGTASRLLNPLSPTFREEQSLEKQEDKTDKEQAKDLVYTFLPLHKCLLTVSHRKSKPVCAWPKWSFAV